MGELVEIAHIGWQCTTRRCPAVFHYAQWGAAVARHDQERLAEDRAESRGKAEAEGWLFLTETRSRPTGREAVRHYCPRCAPVALARDSLRAAERQR